MPRRVICLSAAILVGGFASLGQAEPPSGQTPPSADALLAYARPQTLVALPDGRRLNLYCLGEGRPTVILDGGLGESTLTWAKVQPALARTTRVCSYDRAGYAFSDPGPFPRDAQHIVADLQQLVRAADLAPPYVLVGHSLTGQTMRLFASREPASTAALVLVDPALDYAQRRAARVSPAVGALIGEGKAKSDGCMQTIAAAKPREDMFKACGGPPPKIPGYPEALNEVLAAMYLDPVFARTGISEAESMSAVNADQIAAEQRAYGPVPLVVLTATQRGEADSPELCQDLQKVWLAAHREIVALSSEGRLVEVEGADHGMQYGKPDAVVAAIEDVVATVRRGRR
ncbi:MULTISPECIES: alpha/beta fold hydrolase [unclassified Phenylobacterium]|jgi:pimeloyl-ACP methyl ester carboxylesterase|uniref:alpha/beta fold hydrolase n=1 Tax=unclassified Phenylobacterium TaxID=2640670 RepID=UPI00083B73AB|nr:MULTISPECIES: alpha/beta hydrolase [unclassified Phenylobacterium]